jgi:hypothetical protein
MLFFYSQVNQTSAYSLKVIFSTKKGEKIKKEKAKQMLDFPSNN